MIKLPAIFKDHAVFQRDKEFKIWGICDCSEVKVSVFDENGIIISEGKNKSDEGEFCIVLDAFEAGGPYNLIIDTPDTFIGEKLSTSYEHRTGSQPDTDTVIGEKLELKDIYFGDVWLAGGQSNMEFELKNSKDDKEEIKDSRNEWIRFYNVPRIAWLGSELEEAERSSRWQLCIPEEVGEWSAVGYYFAKALSEESEGIMIGIIGCNMGGTSASCWMSREKLLEHLETKGYIEDYDRVTEGQNELEYLKEYDDYVKYQAEFDKNVGAYYSTCPNPTWDEAIALFGENKYPGPMGPKNWTRPCGLYETMLKRIAPIGLAGCIYYQGEEDDNRPYSYKRLLTSLIEQFRTDFEDEKLPFIIAQLPIFLNEGEEDYGNWPFIREAQSQVAAEIGNGVAVILEAGEYHNIHPTNKETVGYRLAFQALHRVYGCFSKWEACGPEYDSCFVNEEVMYIDLKCCDSGLLTYGDDGFLENVHMMDYLPGDSGFEMAGEDGIYYRAKVQVLRGENVEDANTEKDFEAFDPLYDDEPVQSNAAFGGILTLKLTSENVSKPKYARYFWKNYGKVRIFGANGIPLAPFRTSMNDNARARGSRQGAILDDIK